MQILQSLKTSVESILAEEVSRIFSEVPYAGHLTADNEELDDAYYLRHRVETICRIRLTSKTDALALFHMVDEDYDAARLWARYLTQELNHDLLFLKDMHQHGFSNEDVFSVPPFASTSALIQYLTRAIHHSGALPAVAYSLFVEWNSMRGSAKVVEKAEKKYSQTYVMGSKAHIGIDVEQAHYAGMLDVAHRLLEKSGQAEASLIELLRDISGFFRAYFNELYEHTIGARSS